jgi:two-component system nitrogen regulation sensor histidine kinase NtrY
MQQLICDRQQVTRALTNLVKNAAESVLARIDRDLAGGATPVPGAIVIGVADSGDCVAITITDNGIGLPAEGRDRLTEPYVTTRARGTGLGLAIVKKIVEDHGGALMLDDAPGGGAIVRATFSRGLAVDQGDPPAQLRLVG